LAELEEQAIKKPPPPSQQPPPKSLAEKVETKSFAEKAAFARAARHANKSAAQSAAPIPGAPIPAANAKSFDEIMGMRDDGKRSVYNDAAPDEAAYEDELGLVPSKIINNQIGPQPQQPSP